MAAVDNLEAHLIADFPDTKFLKVWQCIVIIVSPNSDTCLTRFPENLLLLVVQEIYILV